MAATDEQSKSEEATPFKLAKAREKGSVARGLDLGFFATISAFLLFLTLTGATVAARMLVIMRAGFVDFAALNEPRQALTVIGRDATEAFSVVVLLGLTLLVVAIPVELFQLKGLVFSAQPLKPDFTRLNPAKGFKRLFSVRTLKDAVKSLLKLTVYVVLALIAVRFVLTKAGLAPLATAQIGLLLWSATLRLLALFAAAALVFAAIDPVIARREFAKQMRMSRTEVKREFKEREGEPRIKAKRKQLHREFLKQTEGIGKLGGSDLVLVNPEHYAVALVYDSSTMAAPTVRAKARNRLALAMRSEAFRLSIPVICDPPLARSLFKSTASGKEIGPGHYREVAHHYSVLRAEQEKEPGQC